MATSTLHLYKTNITPDRNAIIEDIDSFLDNKCQKTHSISEFQYQKIDLNMTIVIPEAQQYVGAAICNYAKITQEGKNFYFFVMKADWVSKSSIRLELSMDTLNTYQSDIIFTDKTSIIRQHGKSLKLAGETDSKVGFKNINRVIDREFENIPLKKVRKSVKVINDTDDKNWYLIYKTREGLTPENISNPIQCGIVADSKLPVGFSGDTGTTHTLTPSNLGVDKYYYLSFNENPNASVNIASGFSTVITKSGDSLPWTQVIIPSMYFVPCGISSSKGVGNVVKALIIKVQGNKIHVECDGDNYVDYKPYNKPACPVEFTCSSLSISGLAQLRVSTQKIGYENIKDIFDIEYYGNSGKIYTLGINDIDKTDSKLMKIFRLPYAPIKITKQSNGLYKFPNEWEYKDGLMTLKVNNLNYEFENKLPTRLDVSEELSLKAEISPYEEKNTKFESKLYNSEFYTYKVVYDSFVKEFKMEDFDVWNPYNHDTDGNLPIEISFKPTNTINSKFAFKFNAEVSNKIKYTHNSDYDDYLLVNRNNEESIFNNNYINYINSGYNYDKKQKSMALAQSLLGVGIGVGQTAATFGAQRHAAGKEFENLWGNKADLWNTKGDLKRQYASNSLSPFLSAAAISTGFGVANNILNTAFSQAQSQLAIDRKLEELSKQSSQVAGSDDVDLLEYYNKNRLNLMTYDIDDLPKNNLYDLFYYAGYSHLIQDKPNINSRYWFNYVQCNPVFQDENTSAYNLYLDDIKYRFSNGVTYFHHHPETGEGWDFNQKYENFDVNVLNTNYFTKSKFNGHGFELAAVKNDDTTFNLPVLTVKINADSWTYTDYDIEWIDTDGNKNYIRNLEGNINLQIPLFNFSGPSWQSGSVIRARRLDRYNHSFDSDWEVVNYTIQN